MKTQNKIRYALVLLSLLSLFIITTSVAKNSASAQENDQVVFSHSSPESVMRWWEEHDLPQEGLRILTADELRAVDVITAPNSCDYTLWNRNEDHDGPITTNSGEVIKFEATFCDETNEVLMTAGTDWWGYNNLSQHFWAYIVMKDAETDLFLWAWTIDANSIPDLDLQALVEQIPEEAFPLNHRQVRFVFDGNVQMEGSDEVANKIVEIVITPNSGTVRLVKGGNVVIDSVFELIRINNDGTAELVERITIRPFHIQEIDGKQVAVIDWEDLSGPIDALGVANYYLQERIDLSPKAWSVDPESGNKIWPVWEISLDASNQIFVARVDNVAYFVYLPLILSGDGEDLPPVCPANVVDISLNGSIFRANDDFTTTGVLNSIRTLHPTDQTLEIGMTRLLSMGLTPHKVQLWLDNAPYGHYDPEAGIYTFYPGWEYDEQNGLIGPFRMYVFHAEVPVENITCLYKLFIYIDP